MKMKFQMIDILYFKVDNMNIKYIFYYIFIILPISMLIKRKDKLDLNWNNKKNSYWKER